MVDPNHPATKAQISAALPGNSSWVSANAGSGKTRVLTDRVARLLLGGTEPSHILCLTYTKAAAAEMQTRLFKRLGQWAMMPDEKLRAELNELGEDTNSVTAAQLAHARTLFARALETPGGLKIQTIHSFCEKLLRRFPLEAGISPQFEVLEERKVAQILRDVLESMARAGQLDQLAAYKPTLSPEKLQEAVLRHRTRFSAPLDEAALRNILNHPQTLSKDALLNRVLSHASSDDLRHLAAIWKTMGGEKFEKPAGVALELALEKGDPELRLSGLLATILTKDRKPRARGFPTKTVTKEFPQAESLVTDITHALVDVCEHDNAEAALNSSLALNRFALAFLDHYTQAKQVIGKYDFDDLVLHARTLLRDSEAAAWVQYRLDGGIDHILVDEAQDTSLVQWDVIDALADDFFSGSGARDLVRTIFVVGDEKQSIYSFQGADPKAFGTKKDHYSRALDAATIGLESCDLTYSFRSANSILSLVDQVFRDNPVHGLGDRISHLAFHDQKPGRVDLWPFIEKPDKVDPVPWHVVQDCPPTDNPEQILASRIATHISETLREGTALPGTDRPITPGDFLILVRSRGKLFQAIIQEMKKAKVPISGADRLKVAAELAVRDLLALMRFLLNETDDLSLAAILRSPLFNLSEEALFALAHGREGSLWQQLRQASAHQNIVKELLLLRNRADFLRPYEILELLLTTLDKRRAFTARMGAETQEGIDALLDLALNYEQVEPPTLTGFVEWMDSSDAEVKRQFDARQGEVRIMTVHGAKGLEAPIVILPETHMSGNSGNLPPITFAQGHPLLRTTQSEMPAVMADADDERKKLEQEERWRLLYVAMTRAESWLIICGCGTKGKPETGWYAAVEDAMQTMEAEADDSGLHLARNWQQTAISEETPPDRTLSTLPDWAIETAPVATTALQAISPSRDGGAQHALPGAQGDIGDIAMQRGTHLHALLQHLPVVPEADRQTEAENLLRDVNDTERQQLIAEARSVLSAPHLNWVFQGNALREVPVVGKVHALGPRPVRGQIDIVIPSDEIWALDFKSNRVVPQNTAAIPDALIGQMALYSAALSEIWPDKTIRTGIIWTATAELMDIPQDIVNNWLQSKWTG